MQMNERGLMTVGMNAFLSTVTPHAQEPTLHTTDTPNKDFLLFSF